MGIYGIDLSMCDRCQCRATSEEEERGWPVADLDGGYTCPDCYGDEAYCECGALLSARIDVSRCPRCQATALSPERRPDLYEECLVAGVECLSLTEEGCALAEDAGLTVDVDAYGCAYVMPPAVERGQ